MEWENYNVERNAEDFVYEFFSEGPNGKIKKAVKFQQVPVYSRIFFNLAFGDVDESTGKLNDMVVSNNHDQLKVLHTVAKIVADFTNYWPKAIIQISGSTPSRTRLYQMGISSFRHEISKDFEIYGEYGEDWEPFRKGVNYERFLIFRKIS